MRPAKIGQYRQRVQLQILQTPETFDSFAQPQQVWTTVGTYWAKVRPLSGNELVAAKQVKAQAHLIVEIRYQGGSVPVSPQHRLLLNGRQLGVFEIRNIEERNRRYEMTCYEIQMGAAV